MCGLQNRRDKQNLDINLIRIQHYVRSMHACTICWIHSKFCCSSHVCSYRCSCFHFDVGSSPAALRSSTKTRCSGGVPFSYSSDSNLILENNCSLGSFVIPSHEDTTSPPISWAVSSSVTNATADTPPLKVAQQPKWLPTASAGLWGWSPFQKMQNVSAWIELARRPRLAGGSGATEPRNSGSSRTTQVSQVDHSWMRGWHVVVVCLMDMLGAHC